jgi:hypothetical protein
VNVTLWFPVNGSKQKVQTPTYKEIGLQQGKRATNNTSKK